ncbi:hypothetical protein ACN4EG_10480 [Alkalinema pantanalense CENA528]|uniref:hypothetical protein n=1 Tax=Alkalinema pantanalense TaxID=1620705 RepID=UPI003D6DFCDD
MLYLAQVAIRDLPEETSGFQLLAVQESEDAWAVLSGETLLSSGQAEKFSPNLLVLVETSGNKDILRIYDAKTWILEIVQRYLTCGITPEFIIQERERAEQWRQSLTLQSQELDRRALELEARREQIQALEEELKREKRRLEAGQGDFSDSTSENAG